MGGVGVNTIVYQSVEVSTSVYQNIWEETSKKWALESKT